MTCKGVPGDVGSLTLSSGTLTVGRAFEETKPYLRSRKQFESLLKVTLALASDDPYQDEAWHALASQPNPVTSTTTYCLVGGDKVDLRRERLRPDSAAASRTVRCGAGRTARW